MEENIIKYLAGEISKDKLSADEVRELDELELLDNSIKTNFIMEEPQELESKIMVKYEHAMKRKSSWNLVKWWIGVTSGILIALVLIVSGNEADTTPVLEQIPNLAEPITQFFATSYASTILVFVNLITLLFILDRLLSRRVKLQR